MLKNNFNLKGLTNPEVEASRKLNGQNRLNFKNENGFLEAIKSLAKEPMILLLFIAAVIYFVTGKIGDGIFLSIAIVLVAAISLFQDSRSRNALKKLKEYVKPLCTVIRNGDTIEISSEEIVIGDLLMVEEGTIIVADGTIVHSNDFSVNESILTGESLAIFKDKTGSDNKIYLGCTVATGLAVAEVTAIGNETKLGKIGKSLESIDEEKTPLEIQINNFVKKMVLIGALVFLFVWVINFLNSKSVIDSLLKALTLAMSILPEEIPVAFTTFMALGAWRLMKMGVVVKQMKTVETLGSATVICVDKTGTITENKMSLAAIYTFSSDKSKKTTLKLDTEEFELIRIAMFASEPIPFDAMEKALHESYENNVEQDERKEYSLFHEYPLNGKPPMMTHFFRNESGSGIIAAKGAPEAILNVSYVSDENRAKIEVQITQLAAQGYRLLGVAEANYFDHDFPTTQQELKFNFKGIVAFYDPPKKNIEEVLRKFYQAGISVRIITGDNAETTGTIARQINFAGYDHSILGSELTKLDPGQLKEAVRSNRLFVRMFPEAKLDVINSLKADNEIVAMIGDGVNDGPALKAAHIGIAMGKKGTEIAKQAASLILVDDDLSKLVDAIAMGRKIYSNLKKAIQYIISIHIPIILTVFIPLALGWKFPNIFSPVHVIFLELIMGPTCSIIYENEPIEQNTMIQKPRSINTTFFNWNELATSVLQGLLITLGTLAIYQYSVSENFNEAVTRTMVFTTLIIANIALTLVNRSFYYSILTTLKYKNNLVPIMIGITVCILMLLLFIHPLSHYFEFETLNLFQLFLSGCVGVISVIWFEIVKWRIRRKAVYSLI